MAAAILDSYVDKSQNGFVLKALCGVGRMEDDAKYFARRAADERAAAQRTKLPAARRAHLELAERYEDLGRAIGLTQTSPMLRVVQPGSPVATAE